MPQHQPLGTWPFLLPSLLLTYSPLVPMPLPPSPCALPPPSHPSCLSRAADDELASSRARRATPEVAAICPAPNYRRRPTGQYSPSLPIHGGRPQVLMGRAGCRAGLGVGGGGRRGRQGSGQVLTTSGGQLTSCVAPPNGHSLAAQILLRELLAANNSEPRISPQKCPQDILCIYTYRIATS